MTRMLHKKTLYVWLLIIALVIAGGIAVARILSAIDSYD
jgi:hypothetical protein